jgi:hypothetical protein
MHQDLGTHNIPTTGLTRARLAAKLTFTEVPWNAQTREIFYSNGKAMYSEQMHQCVFDCDSEIATDETVYRSNLREVQEWPLGWPRT